MATHVRKKLDGRTTQRFINEIQEDEALILNWKCGPYMSNTKLNTVSISRWPNKGTLMLQGPDAATNKLNVRLQMIMRNEGWRSRSENVSQEGASGSGNRIETNKPNGGKWEQRRMIR